MPIVQREILDLNDAFKEDKNLEQMVLGLELPEVETEGVTQEQARLRLETARETLEGRTDLLWLEDYFMLRDKGFPFRQAAYIVWEATPHDDREPKTQKELASLLGLSSDRAISTWRKKNPAIIETISLMASKPLWTNRANAIAKLIQGMKRAGSDYKFFNHLKLYLEMTGDYLPTSKFMADLKKKISSDPSELSDGEIAVLAKAYEDYQIHKQDADMEQEKE